ALLSIPSGTRLDPDFYEGLATVLMIAFGVGLLVSAPLLSIIFWMEVKPGQKAGLWKKAIVAFLAIIGTVLASLGFLRLRTVYVTCYMSMKLDRTPREHRSSGRDSQESAQLTLLCRLRERGAVSDATFEKVLRSRIRRTA
ncbi:MAG: hypothetical protein V2A71_01380, partial [Candidatus Eisenbacteria bacterium]